MPKLSLPRIMFRKRQTINPNGLRDMNAKEVKVSVVFTRLNEVDTMNEKFSCEATIFASWIDYADDLQKTVDDDDSYYWDPENHWDPQLYIDNAMGEVKEKDVKYNFERYYDKERDEYYVEVNMIKRIQGTFFEKLELYHFPFDVQDLSLTITSHRPSSEIYINQDLENPSKITKHASLDKHIWKLHEHVNIKMHTITNDFQLNHGLVDNIIYNHAAITIQCRVSRKPGYFVVNCLVPTLMITLCVFFTFLMDYERLQYRFSLLFTTMLTSITFRWSIHGRVLPTVSYLTFLDMYCISSILIVFFCMLWHAIYAQIHEQNAHLAERCDLYAMWAFVVAVILMHVTQTIWFAIAFKKRHELDVLDKNQALDYFKIRSSVMHHHNATVRHPSSSRKSASPMNANDATAPVINSVNTNGSVFGGGYDTVTIKPRKIYYSYSKLQNANNMTIFRLRQKEKLQDLDGVNGYRSSSTDKEDLVDNHKVANSVACNVLSNIEFSLSTSDNLSANIKQNNINNNNNDTISSSLTTTTNTNGTAKAAFDQYQYIPLLIKQQSSTSKDSREENL